MNLKGLKSYFFVLSFVSMFFTACTSSVLDEEQPLVSDEMPKISISIQTPSAGGVVVKRASKATTVPDDVDESTVNTVQVYLFKKNEAASANNDTDYTYFSTSTFQTSDQTLTDGKAGEKTCMLPIGSELMGKTVKVAIVANEQNPLGGVSLTKGSTTLEAFKKALATATVSTGNACDVLVGGTAAKSFPMSAISEAEYKLTPTGADVAATLVRNVARLDIFNYTPNLTITGVEIQNVNSTSCIFGAASALNLPDALTKINLKPLDAFQTKLTSGVKYDSSSSLLEEIKTKNTHKVAYLYEQQVTNILIESPKVVITYKLNIGGKDKSGVVTVKFQKPGVGVGAFEGVSVKRNHLYTIKLGDGTNVSTGLVKAQFIVKDWVSQGNEVDSDMNIKK